LRKKRSEIITERSKVLSPIEKRIAKAEAEIERHENILKELHAQIQDATLSKNGKKIFDISQAILKSEQAIEANFAELEEMHIKLEKHQAEFEDRLAQVSE
jgi:ATP-binding cassette, subfamily F, member 3